jgi:hypothetical protein
VATAIAQIVNYHKHIGSLSFGDADEYITINGIDIDADSTNYDFPSFEQLNTYLDTVSFRYQSGTDLDNTDIAALNFACGIATEMDYSRDSSSSSTYATQKAFLNKFNFYSADLIGGLSGESYYTLQENIINQLPTLLAIRQEDEGGHVVICDGYNTNNEYHLNFGWGSSNPEVITEAWYKLPTDIPSGYNIIGEVILNIQPDQPSINVHPTSLVFYSRPGHDSESESIYIQNNTAEDILINSISSPEGFIIAHSNDGYSNFIDSFSINAGQMDSIVVIFSSAEAGSCHGLLTIDYNNGRIKYVILKGSCFSGGTEIPAGNVSGTWSNANSPYFVSGDIQVEPNDTLIIDPGVKVIFVGHYGMTVGENACLTAIGTANNFIEFTALDKQTGWNGLRFIDSGKDDILRYCSINYSKKSYDPATWQGYEDNSGGGVYCRISNPIIANCKIINNIADRGGGIFFEDMPDGDSCPLVISSLIANNSAIGACPQGGGICSQWDSVPIIINCTIVNNSHEGIYAASHKGMYVTNTIILGNSVSQIKSYESTPVVSFCDVQGGYAGEGNIDVDPCFIKPSLGIGADYDGLSANWTLRSSSGCINSGTLDINEPNLPATDLAGNPRIYSNAIDIGAYENQSELPLITTVPSSFIDMGFTSLDTNSTRDVNIINTGEIDFKIQSLTINPDANNVFSIVTPIQDYVLLPGNSIQVEIRFDPKQEMHYSGILHIYSDSSNFPHKEINLSGVGVVGTIIPAGPVSGTWAKAESPFSITGDISVNEGKTLIIEPGVLVKFAGHFGLTVGYNATLHAMGTEAENIVFIPTNTDEGWFGIRFIDSGSDDILKYCKIEYSKKPSTSTVGKEGCNIKGGGIFCYGLSLSPIIDHCLITNNHAHHGGGIYAICGGGTPVITNNVIANNSTDTSGGGIHINDCQALISNNLIINNYAMWGGGGITNLGVSCSTINNNTIVKNEPSGLWLSPPRCPTKLVIKNNIIWRNQISLSESAEPSDYDICYNNIQSGWEGQGNIDEDPLFVDPNNGDYHLKSQVGRWEPVTQAWITDDVTSLCIDAGDPNSDWSNEPWPNGQRINMGAYGGTSQASMSLLTY